MGDGYGNPAPLNTNTGKVGRATFQDNRRDVGIHDSPVAVRTPIEGAARMGYLDRIAGRPFAPEYMPESGQWQRNYEAGRQWAIAIASIGLTPVDWPDGAKTPPAILAQLDDVRRVTGCGTRPEDTKSWDRPAPNNDPIFAVVPVLRRGRIVERLSQ